MCYSAMVQQHLKQLSFKFNARIDYSAFTELFESRLKGNKITVPKALEFNFTHDPQLPEERKIRDLIVEYNNQQQSKDEQELFKQQKRLTAAKHTIENKPTKKAIEEQRIATHKIEWYKERIKKRKSPSLIETDSRIFPLCFAPVIRSKDNELIIEPRRYLLRPRGQPESFDRKYNGCYNAREDSLEKVFFWKNLFGKNHAMMVITEFFENVPEYLYQKRELKTGEEEKNLILRFQPRGIKEMYIPCVFDDWEEKDKWDLHSFALITTNPPPEIAATGHNRCPIFLQDKNIIPWLNPANKSMKDLHAILSEKQTPFYEHALVA